MVRKLSTLICMAGITALVGCDPPKPPDYMMPPPRNNQIPRYNEPTPEEQHQRELAAKKNQEMWGGPNPPGSAKPFGETRIRPGTESPETPEKKAK